MPVMQLVDSFFIEEPTIKNDIVKRIPFIEGSQPVSAIRPLENLRDRYYANSAVLGQNQPSQAHMIARTNPAVKAAISPVTLDATGMGSTYRLNDEALRQYSLGSYLYSMGATYYQTRP